MCKWRYIDFSLSCNFASPCDQRVRLCYGLEPPKVSHHICRFDSYRHSECGDIIILVCHVILQDHVMNGHLTLWLEAT